MFVFMLYVIEVGFLTISDAVQAKSSGISSQAVLVSVNTEVMLPSSEVVASVGSRLHNFSPTATRKSIFSLCIFQAL
jgi:hypothetical protein